MKPKHFRPKLRLRLQLRGFKNPKLRVLKKLKLRLRLQLRAFKNSKLRLRDLTKASASLRLRNLGLRTHVCLERPLPIQKIPIRQHNQGSSEFTVHCTMYIVSSGCISWANLWIEELLHFRNRKILRVVGIMRILAHWVLFTALIWC